MKLHILNDLYIEFGAMVRKPGIVIERRILMIRGEKVLLDIDLAKLYAPKPVH